MKFKDILDEVIKGSVFGLPQSTDWLRMNYDGIIHTISGDTYVIERWMYDEDNWQLRR